MTVRVAVVGLGKITQLHHLPALVHQDDVEVVALCDLSGTLAAQLAQQYGLPADVATTSTVQALERDVDAVVVATTDHAPTLGPAIDAGIATFVEKPCTWTVGEADAILAHAEAADVPVQVGYVKQFDPAVLRLREEISTGPEPLHVRIHNFAGGRHRHERIHRILKPTDVSPTSGPSERDSVVERIAAELGSSDPAAIAAFQSLALLAIHDLNLCRWMWGDPDQFAITSRSGVHGRCFLVTLGYPTHQVSLEVLADFATARDWDEHVAVYLPGDCRTVEFGSPFHRTSPSTLVRRYADGTLIRDDRTIVSYESAFEFQMRAFLDAVAKRTGQGPGLREARDDLDLVYRLARTLAV